jgi:hypothetical protein
MNLSKEIYHLTHTSISNRINPNIWKPAWDTILNSVEYNFSSWNASSIRNEVEMPFLHRIKTLIQDHLYQRSDDFEKQFRLTK